MHVDEDLLILDVLFQGFLVALEVQIYLVHFFIEGGVVLREEASLASTNLVPSVAAEFRSVGLGLL